MFVGLAGGFLSGLFGVGGGIVMVPLLIALVGMDQRRAAATSLAAIVPTAIAGTITYLVQGEVDLLAAVLVAIGGVIGSWTGSHLLRRLPLGGLRWAFIALLVLVAIRMLVDVPVRGVDVEIDLWAGVALVVLGLVVGLLSGLFGIGGGLMMVPAFVVIFGMSDLLAKGTSLAVMLPTALSGSLANLRGGLVDVRAGAIVGIAAVLASFGGVALAFTLPPVLATWLFVALIIASIAQLAIRAIRTRGTD